MHQVGWSAKHNNPPTQDISKACLFSRHLLKKGVQRGYTYLQ